MTPKNNTILDKVIDSQKKMAQVKFEPVSIVKSLADGLSDRESAVITCRYGLFGNKICTLESLGQKYDITRERVRQIERQVVEKMKNHSDYSSLIEPAKTIVLTIIDDHGGLMEREHLLDELSVPSEEVNEIRPSVLFLIEALLDDKLTKIKPDQIFKEGFALKNTKLDFAKKFIAEIKQHLIDNKEPVVFEELHGGLQQKPFYESHKDQLTEKTLISLLTIAQEIEKNIFGHLGLKEWPTVSPRRMGDKSYLVLKQIKKPLHFKEIAEEINKVGFDAKKAYAETIHNELISDKRFVLVGRGTYGLTEWGLKHGIVADVIKGILQEAQGPISREKLIKEVLKQRMVKPETVILALNSKTHFKKNLDGSYSLVE